MDMDFNLGNLDFLDEIVRVNYSIFKGLYLWEPFSLEGYKEKLGKISPLIYVARVEGRIVGDAISFERGDSLYIWILGVSENFRKQGIASKLFEMTEDYALNNGFKSVTTKVYNVSKDMLALTSKRGYEIVKVVPSESNSKYDALYLKLDLAPKK